MYASVVARGSGWQDIGAYVNLGAYYPVGVLVGVVLAFVVHLKGRGLQTTVQVFLLTLKTSFTNWEKQVISTQKKKKNPSYIFVFIITPFYN